MDLIYGLPGQSVEVFARDLHQAVEGLGASAVDLYELVLYPNSPLAFGLSDLRGRVPDDADRGAMYELAVDTFAARGYGSWTLEDFCLPGSEYRMKQLTYGCEDGQAQTLALGACAVGYMGGYGYRNEVLEGYLSSPSDRLPVSLLRCASPTERRRRPLFFFPRRLELDPGRLAWPLLEEELALLGRQAEMGLSRRDADGRWRVTREGRLRADEMVRQLVSSSEYRKLFKLVQ
jgi:coproporphyrinogen III oxidase-like Fe-S oxidoreductase